MKNILFALMIGALMYNCSFIETYRHQEEIREQFDSVNNALIKSDQKIIKGKEGEIDDLIRQIENNQGKSAKAMTLLIAACKVKAKSDSLTTFINSLKDTIELRGKDDADLNVGTKLLAEGPDGTQLKKKMGDYKHDIEDLMKKYPLISSIPINIDPPTPGTDEKLSWEKAYFNMVPKVAVLTILNKFKNDVKSTEVMCVERLSKEDMK